jgi:iron complex outermembrane receptor protein
MRLVNEPRRLALMGGAATLALAISSAVPAFAQDAGTADQTQTSETEAAPDEIVVTGFRASLESAVAEKKALTMIVESISAEDIG